MSSTFADYVRELHFELLPIAVYAVTRDGTFVAGNARLFELLHLTNDTLSANNIQSFYERAADREVLMKAAEERDTIEKQVVPFIVDGKTMSVQVFCRAIRYPQNDVAGFIGALVEVTREHEYLNLLDRHLPAGVYTLDANDTIVRANDGLARLHGFEQAADMEGRNVRDFYEHPETADRMRHQIVADGALIRVKVQLSRRDGQLFPAYVTAIPFVTNGVYTGRGGVIEDRTAELDSETLLQKNEKLLDDIPVGFYSVEVRGDADVVIKCNRAFALIHDYDSVQQILGVDIRRSHYITEESKRFLMELERAARENRPVLNYKLKIRTRTGRIKTIEIDSRPEMDEKKNLIGRTGAIRDVTEEELLRATVDDLTSNVTTLTSDMAAVTKDVDAVLHVFRQTLMQLSLAAQSAESVLAATPDIDEPMPTDSEIEEAIKAPLHEMISGVRTIVAHLTASNVSREDAEQLAAEADTLENYYTRPQPEWRDLWLDGAVIIHSVVARVAPGAVARSIYRPTLAAAQHVGRITALATLRIARDAILAVDTPVAALREYITSGTRAPEPRTRVRLQDRVNIAIRNLSRFASIRRVRIEFDGSGTTYIEAAAGAVTRAIGNLLHNAIKYSWKRDDSRTWIRVVVQTDDTHAIVTFENWGVPISTDEIEQKLLFQLGYRGRLSSDRGRMGTGVGLSDSLRVAEAHDGAIEVQSRPARTGGNLSDFSQPFITTVSLRLALVPKRRKVNQ